MNPLFILKVCAGIGALGTLIAGVRELRKNRKINEARWNYDRSMKCAEHEMRVKKIPEDAAWFVEGTDKVAMELLGEPYDIPPKISQPWNYFERKRKVGETSKM